MGMKTTPQLRLGAITTLSFLIVFRFLYSHGKRSDIQPISPEKSELEYFKRILTSY